MRCASSCTTRYSRHGAPPLYGPDGSLIAVAAGDGLHLFDAATHRPVASIDAFGSSEIVFAPDGMTYAAGGDAGRVVVCDVDVD